MDSHNLSLSSLKKKERTSYTLISLSHSNCAQWRTRALPSALSKICSVSSSGLCSIFKWIPGGISPLSRNIEGLVASPLFLNYLDGGQNGALPSEKSALVLYILGLPFSKVGLMESLLLNGISGYWRTIHPPSTIFGDSSSRHFTVLFWIVFTSLKIDGTDFILQGLRHLLSYFCIPQKFPNCPTPQPVAIIWNFQKCATTCSPSFKVRTLIHIQVTHFPEMLLCHKWRFSKTNYQL